VAYWFRILARCFANLYDGADLLLITGRIGTSVCVICALSECGEGFFVLRILSVVCL